MSDSAPQFQFQPVLTLISVLLIASFCGLAIWQLDRAGQKKRISESLSLSRELPPVDLNHLPQPSGQIEYRKVMLKGEFIPEKMILIDNRKHQGRSGVHVIVPMQLDGSGNVVLVNMGWRALDELNHLIPGARATISGEARFVSPPALELDAQAVPEDLPPKWPYLTIDRFTAWSGIETLPFIVLASPDTESGYVREWPAPSSNEMMHIGYAIHWFAFALITLLIWYRLSLRRHEPDVEGQA